METAGLVHTTPGRSTVVAAIEPQAVLNAQSVAAAMHALAVRTAVPLMDKSDFDAMTAANHAFAQAISRGDPEAAMRSDDHFHGVAVQASGNEVIEQVLEQVTPVLRRLEYLRFSALSGRESIEQHRRIVSLCRKRDAEGAAAATEQNWQTLSQVVEKLAAEETDTDG